MGLGDAARIERLELDFPDGRRFEARDLVADTAYAVVEGAEGFELRIEPRGPGVTQEPAR